MAVDSGSDDDDNDDDDDDIPLAHFPKRSKGKKDIDVAMYALHSFQNTYDIQNNVNWITLFNESLSAWTWTW